MPRTNGIIDQSAIFDFNQPVPEVEAPEQNALGSLVSTNSWESLKEYLESRKVFYQKYLPGTGLDINTVSNDELVIAWKTAHNIVQEIDNLISLVETYYDAAV